MQNTIFSSKYQLPVYANDKKINTHHFLDSTYFELLSI